MCSTHRDWTRPQHKRATDEFVARLWMDATVARARQMDEGAPSVVRVKLVI